MSTTTAILVMLSNYVHDVATGLLLLSALWLAWSSRDLGDNPGDEAVAIFRRSYRRCKRFVFGSLGVIIGTGAVRALFFMEFEWFPALGRGLIPILILKHVLIVTMLGAGGYAWYHLHLRLKSLLRADAANAGA